MKNDETGEFELVLGNRQLLAGFLIVVILFGVFFTMGYIVGRNSAPSPRLSGASESGQSAKAVDLRPERRQSASPSAQQPAAAPAEAVGSGAPQATADGSPSQPVTQAARESEATKAEPAPSETATAPQTSAIASGQTYLQVMAVRRAEAEVVLRSLKDKGFPATLAPGPSDLLRVLVGPFRDVGSLGKAKADLENAGFHPLVRK